MQTSANLLIGKNNNLTFITLVAALSVICGHTSAIVAGAPADSVAVTTGYLISIFLPPVFWKSDVRYYLGL